jgi:hypothetical protein
MRRTTVGAGLIGLAFALAAGQAAALAQLQLSSGAILAICDDQAACDLNPTAGAVTFTGALGAFTVNVTTGLTTPVLPGIEIDLNSVNVLVEGGVHDLRIVFHETGFSDASGFVVTLGGVLTAPVGSSITATSWFDDLISLEAPIATLGPFGPGAFSATATSGLALSAPYNLTQTVDIQMTGPGSVSFDFTTTGSERVIPEPASAALFAAGALVVGAAVRRRA